MGKLIDAELRAWVRAGNRIPGKSDGLGLTFTLSKAGTASWVFRYRHGGKPSEVTIGNYPDVSLAEARKAATAARAKVDAGIDVASAKKQERSDSIRAKTFEQISNDYLDRAGKDLAERSRSEVSRYLKKDLLPKLGAMRARDISPEEIVRVVEQIGRRSDSVARHAFEILSVIFAHALARSSVKINPCRGLEPRSILGPRPPRRPRLKLSLEELRSLFVSLPALGRVNELTVKILLATCVRKGELIRGRREHLDLHGGKWTVPDENSKSKSGFVVPLAPSVVEWFGELLTIGGNSQWILPSCMGKGRLEDRHMSDKTLNAALARTPIGLRAFTPHDLRSTARSHLAALGVDVIVAERCLNHRLGGLVGIYDQHDYFEERHRALVKWAEILTRTNYQTGNVVPLKSAA